MNKVELTTVDDCFMLTLTDSEDNVLQSHMYDDELTAWLCCEILKMIVEIKEESLLKKVA